MDFVIGGLAGVGAGFFSNPFDVVKTRMQLQGELKAKGQHAVHYKNILHAMYTIVKFDGLAALQKGLLPALCFQLVINGVRLGVYQHADYFGLLRDDKHNTILMNSIAVSGVAGCMGGYLGSPLQLIKTQLMSQSSRRIAVGTQHGHRGALYALRKIVRERGLAALYHGAHGMMLRNGAGSASQIAVFVVSKEKMVNNKTFEGSTFMPTFVASNLAALSKTLLVTPLDVIVTRLYNQQVDAKGSGVLYSGIIDCAQKIVRTEGLLAFYKGMGPSYFRQAPHSILLLVFWDLLKDLHAKYVARDPST